MKSELEAIANSHFILVFSGESPVATTVRGWDALLDAIRNEYTVNDDEHAELLERLEDRDYWVFDSQGEPWHYSENTGEIGNMEIYRVNAFARRGQQLTGIAALD